MITPKSLYQALRAAGIVTWIFEWEYLEPSQQQLIKQILEQAKVKNA